jgi:hypothetical protein
MTDATFDEYFNQRYLPSCKWYGERSRFCKSRYQAWQSALLVLSAMTPVLLMLGEVDADRGKLWRLAAAAASAGTVIAAGTLKTFRYESNWTNYRMTAQALKRERYLLAAGLDDYGVATDAHATFVNRCESLISQESQRWLMTVQPRREAEQSSSEPDAQAQHNGDTVNLGARDDSIGGSGGASLRGNSSPSKESA